MDKESIRILNEITEKLNRICKENDRCTTCNVKRFKEKCGIKCDLCMRTFMAQYLLGDNEDAANFYKEEFKNFKDMCSNTRCKDCEISKLKTKHKELNIDCAVVYFAIKLLKDV